MAGLGLLLAFVVVQHVEAKLPPKFMKAAKGAQKALFATKYGHSVVPLPKRIELETKVAHKVTHGGRGRRGGGKRRRRPTRTTAPYYSNRYRTRNHAVAPIKVYAKPRPVLRRPRHPPLRLRRKPRPRPYYREEEPEYHEQEEEYDEGYDDHEDYYEERRRPVRSHRYRNKRPPSRDHEEEGAYSVQELTYARRPKPYLSGRTNKLYSASIRRPQDYEREESEEPEEEHEEYYHERMTNRGQKVRKEKPPEKYKRQREAERPKTPTRVTLVPETDTPNNGYVPQPSWRPNISLEADREGGNGYPSPHDLDIGFGQGLETVSEEPQSWPVDPRLPYSPGDRINDT